MIEASRGIPGDIDLTENRAFARGAKPLAAENHTVPGKLPWDGQGKSQCRKYRLPTEDIEDMLISYNTNFELIVDGMLRGATDDLVPSLVYDYEYYVTAPGDSSKVIDELHIIDRYRETADLRLLPMLPGSLSISTGRLMYNMANRCQLNRCISYDYSDEITWNTTVARFDTDHGLQTSSNRGWYTISPYVTATNTNSSTRINMRFSNGTDITPTRFGDTQLTTSELNGGIITGHVADIGDKIRLREYMQKVKHVIDVIAKHSTKVIPTGTETTSIHPDHTLLSRSSFERHGLSLHTDRSSFLRDFHFDQSRHYEHREDKTIDYFFQPVCGDRGLCLIRRPRNSHELRVDLDDREFIDEEDTPIAVRKHLTYEKDMLDGDRLPNHWDQVAQLVIDAGGLIRDQI